MKNEDFFSTPCGAEKDKEAIFVAPLRFVDPPTIVPKKRKKKIEVSEERTEWLIACNLRWYDLRGALTKLKVIDWHQVTVMNHCKVGDLVYIYCCGENKPGSIHFKGAILKTNKRSVTIDDSEFNGDLEQGPSFEVAVFREYDFDGELSFKELSGHGLKGSVMGPRKVKDELADYLHFCDKKYIEAHKNDKRIPDTCLSVSKFPFVIDERLKDIEIGLPDSTPKEQVEKHAASLSEDELKKLAQLRSSQKPKVVSQTTQNIRRDEYVARYAKTRAKGICQLCGKEAPFIGSDGEPYLESHHIVWLSKGGADSVENTVALCPNCHRKMHVVKDAHDVERLTIIASQKE